MQILNQRSSTALREGVISSEGLQMIAVSAEGNGETAIQLLRQAAIVGEQSNQEVLSVEFIDTFLSERSAVQSPEHLDRLHQYAAWLYRYVSSNGPLTSQQAYRALKGWCKRKGIPVRSYRTVQSYLETLVDMGLFEEKQLSAIGNVHVYSVANRKREANVTQGTE